MTVTTFEVLGLPSPQGSKRHVGNGRMVESSKTLPVWRDSLTAAAAEQRQIHGTFDGPLHLHVTFRCPMPRSRPKRVRELGEAPKTTAPDLDKLIRAVGDALTVAALIGDDALIAEVSARKVEVTGWTGAVITLTHLLREDTP